MIEVIRMDVQDARNLLDKKVGDVEMVTELGTAGREVARAVVENGNGRETYAVKNDETYQVV